MKELFYNREDKNYDLEKLYEWLMNEKRKPSITAFTSGIARNIASEMEFRLSQSNPVEEEKKDEGDQEQLWEEKPQGEINSILLVNALRLLNEEHRDNLCFSLFERSINKQKLIEKLSKHFTLNRK